MEENNGNIRFLSAISYIGILFVIGHFAVEKNNPDLRFHTYQGGMLFLFFSVLYFADFLIYLLLGFIPAFQTVISVLLTVGISVAYIMLAALGISYALSFKQRFLPFVGAAAMVLRRRLDSRRKDN